MDSQTMPAAAVVACPGVGAAGNPLLRGFGPVRIVLSASIVDCQRDRDLITQKMFATKEFY
jgi:hypothetical protein